MKELICLFALALCACNATLLSLLGGAGGKGGGSGGLAGGGGGGGAGGGTTYTAVATPSHSHGGGVGYGHGHGHAAHGSHASSGAAGQLYKVILEQGHGYSAGHGSSGGYAGGYAHGSHAGNVGGGGGAHTDIYKVVTQNVAVDSGINAGVGVGGSSHSYGNSYASSHGYNTHASIGASGNAETYKVITQNGGGGSQIGGAVGGASYAQGHQSHGYAQGYGAHGGSSIDAILPQILQIVLQNDANGRAGFGGGSAGGAYNSQLIAHFGQKGQVKIMQNMGKAQGAYFKGGRVVEKGTLKVMTVSNDNRGGAARNSISAGNGASSKPGLLSTIISCLTGALSGNNNGRAQLGNAHGNVGVGGGHAGGYNGPHGSRW